MLDLKYGQVKVGNAQEAGNSERNSLSKNQDGESGTCTMKTYRKPSEQVFPNMRPLCGYPN